MALLSKYKERELDYKQVFIDYMESGSSTYVANKHINPNGKPYSPEAILRAVYIFMCENPDFAYSYMQQMDNPQYKNLDIETFKIVAIDGAKKAYRGRRYQKKFKAALKKLGVNNDQYKPYYQDFINQYTS